MTESAARYGNWEVIRSIGRGGQGQVYLVRDASGAPNTRAGLNNLRNAMASLIGVSEDSQYERFGLQFADEIDVETHVAVVRQANWRRMAGESPAEGRSNQPPSPRVMRRSL